MSKRSWDNISSMQYVMDNHFLPAPLSSLWNRSGMGDGEEKGAVKFICEFHPWSKKLWNSEVQIHRAIHMHWDGVHALKQYTHIEVVYWIKVVYYIGVVYMCWSSVHALRESTVLSWSICVETVYMHWHDLLPWCGLRALRKCTCIEVIYMHWCGLYALR